MSKSPLTSPPKPQSDRKCCGVVESVEEVQSQRSKRKHQPWVIRKICILVTLGIIGYSGYAYITRLCLPMIKRMQNALGSQTSGSMLIFDLLTICSLFFLFYSCTIGFLQYSILVDALGLFHGWSLIKDEKTSLNLSFPKIVLTAPGYAREASSRNLDFSNLF